MTPDYGHAALVLFGVVCGFTSLAVLFALTYWCDKVESRLASLEAALERLKGEKG